MEPRSFASPPRDGFAFTPWLWPLRVDRPKPPEPLLPKARCLGQMSSNLGSERCTSDAHCCCSRSFWAWRRWWRRSHGPPRSARDRDERGAGAGQRHGHARTAGGHPRGRCRSTPRATEQRACPRGDAATLEVSVEEPGSVEIPGLGLSTSTDQHTPARFEVFPPAPAATRSSSPRRTGTRAGPRAPWWSHQPADDDRRLRLHARGVPRHAPRADVRLLLDVRQRRGVRGPEYAWANSQRLQAALATPASSTATTPSSRPRPSCASCNTPRTTAGASASAPALSSHPPTASATPPRSWIARIWTRWWPSYRTPAPAHCSASSGIPRPATAP